MPCLRLCACVGLLTCCAALAADAQVAHARVDSLDASPHFTAVAGSGADRLRQETLRGTLTGTTQLIRAASGFSVDTAARPWNQVRWAFLGPMVDATSNSSIPYSVNDGAQWAGRGLTYAIAAGVRAELGRVRIHLVPEFWRAENRQFAFLPGGDPTRSPFSSPYHAGTLSADLPLRFGADPIAAFDLGESALWLTSRGLSAGLSNESLWWGPGIRNAIVMSNNAGGVPHAFLRTAVPIRTRIGAVEGRWIIGSLVESRFFDRDPTNDLRSLSGIVATLAPAVAPDLTVGVSRVVYENIGSAAALPARSLDALFRWGGGFNVRWASGGRAAEQMTALFSRWVFPESRAEVYGEWVRILLPVRVRDLLVAPQFTQGFTAGIQWLPYDAPGGTRVRVQAEVTNLEQSPESQASDTISFYSSTVVPHGYTQRGQVVGAAIGPGASSQWIAADYVTTKRSFGVFVGRIRWDNDAYYRQPTSIAHFSFDVSVFSGVRASARYLERELSAEISLQRRYNFLFQNSLYGYARDTAFDRENVSVRICIAP